MRLRHVGGVNSYEIGNRPYVVELHLFDAEALSCFFVNHWIVSNGLNTNKIF